MHYIVGLGNPGEEYENTRHNTGRIVVTDIASHFNFPDFEKDKYMNADVSVGEIDKKEVTLILPNTFMNKSGNSVKGIKETENIIVVYDDVDLPLTRFRIAFNRGSGGHNGIESITKSLKTKEFVRIRVGITPTSPLGKLKKPKGEKKVLDFLMGNFKKPEVIALKKTSKSLRAVLSSIITDGRVKAMNEFN